MVSDKDIIKLWRDRADELRRKCDEQYAELKRWRNWAAQYGDPMSIFDILNRIRQKCENVLAPGAVQYSALEACLRQVVRDCEVGVSKNATPTPLLPKDGENVNKPTAVDTGVNMAEMRDEAMNEVRIRCTKDGISVEGARDIGSTSDTRADSLSQFLRIAECWWNTYCEKSHRQETGCHGDGAKMREALLAAKRTLEYLSKRMINLSEGDYERILEAEDMTNSALAAPARNCDVGTAEEQTERFTTFCKSQPRLALGNCDPRSCQCYGSANICHCFAKWMQMPYMEGATDGDK